MKKMLKIVAIRCGEPPTVEEIEDTLEAEQKFVGGLIDIIPAFYPEDSLGIDMVINDEGKILCLKPNRIIWHGRDWIAGDAFLVSYDEEGNLVSLSDEQIGICMERFQNLI